MFVALAGTLAPAWSAAVTHEVCSASCPYTTIQSAIDVADEGDVVSVGPGTYNEDLVISTSRLTIRGAGITSTTVDAGFRTVSVTAGAQDVAISDLTLIGGVQLGPADFGAAVHNAGTLTILDVEIRGGISDAGGGGIFTEGDMTLERVIVAENRATPSTEGRGGGLYVASSGLDQPIVNVRSSEFSDNDARFGGGIYVATGARVFIDDTLFSGNRAGDDVLVSQSLHFGRGGAIRTFGELHVTNSEFTENSADLRGGAIAVNCTEAPVYIASSTFTNNWASEADPAALPIGGAIAIDSLGTTDIVDSTFIGNIAGKGGAIGIHQYGELKIRASTLTTNVALTQGGAIYNYGGQITLNNSTVVGNESFGSAGGIYHGNGFASVPELVLHSVTLTGNVAQAEGGGVAAPIHPVTMRNSILAENIDLSGAFPDCVGAVSTEHWNLVGIVDGCIGFGLLDQFGTALSPLSPELGSLQDNGGATLTREPLVGSPAVDASLSCKRLDQRTFRRPVEGGSGYVLCDVGAVELAATCGAPSKAVQISPANGAIDLDTGPLMTWAPVPGAESYDVVLSTSPPPVIGFEVDQVFGTTETSWRPDAALTAGVIYYWVVRANSHCGDTSKTGAFSFTLQ